VQLQKFIQLHIWAKKKGRALTAQALLGFKIENASVKLQKNAHYWLLVFHTDIEKTKLRG